VHLDAMKQLFVCPRCKSSLADYASAACPRCGFSITINNNGFWEFGEMQFVDHWATDPVKRERFIREEVPREETRNRNFTRSLVIPLIHALFGDRTDVTVLSSGCGLGFDVDILRSQGYAAWGNDNGSRVELWHLRENRHYLVRCSSEELPFPDNYFDLVLSHQVLEHVGVEGDTINVKPDYLQIRQRFLNSLLRVAKRGGYLNISTPNRCFPIDPGHAQGRFGVRLHGPGDRFLTSYGDMRKYFPGQKIIALSPKGFYSGTCVGRFGALKTLFDLYLGVLDKIPPLRPTFLNPLTNVLIQKIIKTN
jgi:SAM-dependent methyltransferase